MKPTYAFKTYQKLLVCAIPFAAVAAAALFGCITDYKVDLYDCMFYKYTGMYCPGCGITRAVLALLQGNVLLSLRQNAMAAIGGALLIMLYAELLFRAFGKEIRTPARNGRVLVGILIFWGIYSIARNFIPAIAPVTV